MPEVIFGGSEGRIEGRFHPGESKSSPIALILHPHPDHGGTMNNKVVYSMYRSFVDCGYGALRFNFRGIGKSEGVYDGGEGELADAASALDWLQLTFPEARSFWVGGFSFGAWIGMQLLMRRPELESFIAISPPANKYDFSFLAPCPVSGQIIQGKQDDIVTEKSVAALVQKLNGQRGVNIDYKIFPEAGHFFENDLAKLSGLIKTYIQDHQKTQKYAA